jgi:hypothetical protein
MKLVYSILLILSASCAFAQLDSLDEANDSTMNVEANYKRPFLTSSRSPLALGGYIEANTLYSGTDGVEEGFSFQFRRLTLFASSKISEYIRFLTEIEFEDGTKEINIEYAAVDLMLHPLANLRGGIVLNPIGAFNQKHDGPQWDFVDRPIEATELLGATLSNVGVGLYGKAFRSDLAFSYELYLTNGFDDRVIDNGLSRTSLAEGKLNPEKFEESPSGIPLFTGKLAVRHRKVGEVAVSYMTGVYNTWKSDGVVIDEKRSVSVLALDVNASLTSTTDIRGEVATVNVDVPQTYSQQFGRRQLGGYFDIIQTLYEGKILVFDNAKVSLGLRGEYVDFNIGTFDETGGNIADDVTAFTVAASLRPSAETVIKMNYRYLIEQDLLGNPPSHTSLLQFGIATYF